MSNVTFLWIFSRGIELGVVVLCLLPIRALLRKKVPRVFSYLLWSALPVNVVYNMCMSVLIRRKRWIIDRVYKSPQVVVDEPIINVLKSVWIFGTLLVLCWMLGTYIRFQRRLIGSIRIREGIYLAERISTPFTLGVFHPKIYLPTSLSEEYYDAIILHEKVHIMRKDVWMKYLGITFLGLFWFQPVLWFAYKKFVTDMEVACDETVLRQKGTEYCEEYARILVETSCREEKAKGAALGYVNGEIKDRIRTVMNYKNTKHSARIMALVVCVIAIILAIPLSWQVPRLVRSEEHETSTGEMLVEKYGVSKKKTTNE